MHPLPLSPTPPPSSISAKPNRFRRELTRYIRFESVDIYIKLMFTQVSHWRAEDFLCMEKRTWAKPEPDPDSGFGT